LCGGASVKGLAAAPETDVWLRLARGARASAGLDSPVDPFAREGSAYVSLVHRACHCCDDRRGAAVESQG
jgi:hypothetical protein